jgi:hypothetical protein
VVMVIGSGSGFSFHTNLDIIGHKIARIRKRRGKYGQNMTTLVT